jgi:hypothetical protein
MITKPLKSICANGKCEALNQNFGTFYFEAIHNKWVSLDCKVHPNWIATVCANGSKIIHASANAKNKTIAFAHRFKSIANYTHAFVCFLCSERKRHLYGDAKCHTIRLLSRQGPRSLPAASLIYTRIKRGHKGQPFSWSAILAPDARATNTCFFTRHMEAAFIFPYHVRYLRTHFVTFEENNFICLIHFRTALRVQ